ncbi:MAG: HPP family protein [Phycisphaerae bacterium]|nr:HPP family protein [Phycisphaerae bacterium]
MGRTSRAGTGLSLKMRWMICRARFSTPGLLTRFDERKVVSIVAAINGGMAILTISFFAWLTDLPLVFPALGPSTFILFSAPLSVAAAPRSVILGHLSALACGTVVWHGRRLLLVEATLAEGGDWTVYLGAALALALACLVLVRLGCPHPPACASSLVVALGGVTAWRDLLLMALAVIWLAMQAVIMNRLAGVSMPIWSYHPREPNSP